MTDGDPGSGDWVVHRPNVVRSAAERHTGVTMLRTALADLADEDRQLLLDRHVHDRAVTDIATTLDIRPHAVTMRLRRAEERLAGAFAAAHAHNVNHPECRTTRAAMHDYLKGRLLPRRQRRLEVHMDGCTDCTRAFIDVREVSWMLRDLGQHLIDATLITSTAGTAGAGNAGVARGRPRSIGTKEAAVAAGVLTAIAVGGGATALIASRPDHPSIQAIGDIIGGAGPDQPENADRLRSIPPTDPQPRPATTPKEDAVPAPQPATKQEASVPAPAPEPAAEPRPEPGPAEPGPASAPERDEQRPAAPPAEPAPEEPRPEKPGPEEPEGPPAPEPGPGAGPAPEPQPESEPQPRPEQPFAPSPPRADAAAGGPPGNPDNLDGKGNDQGRAATRVPTPSTTTGRTRETTNPASVSS